VDAVAQGVDDDRPHGDRRHEVAVHDVDVDDLRPGLEHRVDLLAEPREVGAEDRRGQRHMGSSIESPQLWHVVVAVDDIRTIVECSPQLGHTERSS
jgi:hypothetical protein